MMTKNKWISYSFTLGAMFVAVGAIGWMLFKGISGWFMALGGLLMSLSILLHSLNNREESNFRVRRLERMQLISSLLYLVAGGFMIQRSGTWLPIFIAGTVFFVYSTFALARKPLEKS